MHMYLHIAALFIIGKLKSLKHESISNNACSKMVSEENAPCTKGSWSIGISNNSTFSDRDSDIHK